jgi:hypothetical protein
MPTGTPTCTTCKSQVPHDFTSCIVDDLIQTFDRIHIGNWKIISIHRQDNFGPEEIDRISKPVEIQNKFSHKIKQWWFRKS